MTEGVNNQETAAPEKPVQQAESLSSINFRKLEAAREAERERAMRAEMQTEMLKKELELIRQHLQPKETDPLDDLDLDDPDKLRSSLKAKLERERESFRREAKEITKKTLQEYEQEKRNTNYLSDLKREFRDYDEVMNENNLMNLERENPAFLKAVLQVPDEYERRKLTYEYLKSKPKEEKPSIKEKVEDNLRNPYYIPPGSGTPAAVDFDLKSKNAREQAYAKLKAAQRRPITNSPVTR